MLKTIVFILNRKNPVSYLEILINELNQKKIHSLLYYYVEQNEIINIIHTLESKINPIDWYLVTDCMEGEALALRVNLGYSVLETEQNRHLYFSSPQCIIQGFDEVTAGFMIHMYERFHHIPWMIFETKRCRVREIMVDDVPRLYEIYQDPSITKYTEGLFSDMQEEIEFTKAYIQNMYEFFGYGIWIVEEKKSGNVIGRAGLSNREGYDDLELGYIITRSEQRKGYAFEICESILKYGREVLGAEAINSFIRPDNVASIALIKKLGFCQKERVTIEQKDMLRFYKIYNNLTN